MHYNKRRGFRNLNAKSLLGMGADVSYLLALHKTGFLGDCFFLSGESRKIRLKL